MASHNPLVVSECSLGTVSLNCGHSSPPQLEKLLQACTTLSALVQLATRSSIATSLSTLLSHCGLAVGGSGTLDLPRPYMAGPCVALYPVPIFRWKLGLATRLVWARLTKG